MAFISADYEEGKPETFRGYDVVRGDAKKTFSTLEKAISYAETLGVPCAELSSVDDYEVDQKRTYRRLTQTMG